MPAKILFKRVGYSNSALIVNGASSVLVDTGVRFNMKSFRILFREAGLGPGDIKLIVLTHVHYDHTGNLRDLVKYTGAKVLVHKHEFDNLKSGYMPIPEGQGRYSGLISKIGRAVYPKYASPRPFTADLVNDNEFDLLSFGIQGKVISTPGHTKGSQSVLLGKTLISGDTFLNMPNGTIFPHFADDPKTLLTTWQKLFDMDVDTIYPGHGGRFSIDKAIPQFERWKEKLEIT